MSEETVYFESLELPPALRAGIKRAGFETLTPIQSRALPLLMAGRDVAGQAQTGTGKTAAFLLALFDRLLGNPSPKRSKTSAPRAVVLAPTRELAQQIERDATLPTEVTTAVVEPATALTEPATAVASEPAAATATAAEAI